jgi:hypothetical protein
MRNSIRLILAFALVAGCSNNTNGTDGGTDAALANADLATPPDFAMPIVLGTPISAPMNQWTWVDFPDSSCDDGSPTGIGVFPTGSKNLIVFLNGGGACWDYLTCYTLNTAVHGPFGKTQFDAQSGGLNTNTIFDRTDTKNPVHDWNMVFIPYCTGDVHAGDNVATYKDNTGMITKTYHHAGHANVLAYLKRLGATFPQLDKLVVSGSSAGGYGAAFNYDNFRAYWPQAKSYLLDDSGPTLEGDAIPAGYKTAWYANWRLDKVLDPICGDPCKTDLSIATKLLAARYGSDRMALLSSLQDQTISGYFLLSGPAFQTEIEMVAHDILDPTPNFHYFYVTGNTHTMLGGISNFTSQGVPLQMWLQQMIGDDSAWKSENAGM